MKKEGNFYTRGNTIYANIPALTERELKTVKNYRELGYKLVPIKEKKEEKPKDSKFTAKAIQAFLEEKGTKEQNKIYWEKYNAPVIDKETGEQKKYKNGKARVKGHIATIRWFKNEFPDY